MAGTVLAMEDSFPDGKGYPWNPSVEETRMVFDQPDGSVILWEMDDSSGMEEASLFRFDKETKGRTLLADMQGEYLSALCQAGDEMMYYVTGGCLIRWDMAADIRQELAEIYDIGVSTMTNYVGLLCDSEGDVLVCFLEGSSLGIIVLSDEEVQTAEEIRMAYLEPEGPRYSVRLASDYSREHADCPIKTEQNGGDKEAFRNRILMELAAGKGPEMMWVSKEDMAILAGKGALMDLKELIPADIYEQLFSFAVQDCTIGGKMVGVAPWYSLHTMAVSKEVWSDDSWTLSELLDVAENRTDWKLILAPTRYDGYSLFRNLLRGLDGTPFLDMEQGVARFDHEDFIRLLEFCHQNGGAPLRSEQEALNKSDGVSWDEAERILREGDCVAEMCNMYEGLQNFAANLAEFGEDIHMVGYPAYGGSGHYAANYNGYLAVNAKAEHLDEIREYISLLLDYENQFTVIVGLSGKKYELLLFVENWLQEKDWNAEFNGENFRTIGVKYPISKKPRAPKHEGEQEEMSYYVGGAKKGIGEYFGGNYKLQEYLDEPKYLKLNDELNEKTAEICRQNYDILKQFNYRRFVASFFIRIWPRK
ncbi:MAG TPA: hypothetical protein DCZ91_21755, partial [Lachnospiraceae bacterium]|nr:hypothetical protein [Lachnospiraceae bacterium]